MGPSVGYGRQKPKDENVPALTLEPCTQPTRKTRAPVRSSLTEATLAGRRADGAMRRREGRREGRRKGVRKDMQGTRMKAGMLAMLRMVEVWKTRGRVRGGCLQPQAMRRCLCFRWEIISMMTFHDGLRSGISGDKDRYTDPHDFIRS